MVSALIASLLVSEKPVARQVTMPDGSTHELHFKQLSAGAFRQFFAAVKEKDEDAQTKAMAQLISASLCGEDGVHPLTAEQALQLTVHAERALSDAVMDVNGMGKRAEVGNALPPEAKSGSGTS